jgi:hypothetical protein
LEDVILPDMLKSQPFFATGDAFLAVDGSAEHRCWDDSPAFA